MLSRFGSSGRLCDSLSRRELLSVGAVPLLGLGLPELLRSRARAAEKPLNRAPGFGAADSMILVYLQGSPSHIDLWDPKPQAPAEIRGEFQPIATRAPGMMLGEVLPKLAQQADKFSLIRTVGCKPKGLPNHGSAIYMLMTGHDPGNFSPTGLAVPPSRSDLPSIGSVVARYRPADQRGFSYVALGSAVKEGSVVGVGQGAGLLGAAFDPYAMYDDPTQPLKLDVFTLPGEVTLERLKARTDLRRIIETRLGADAPSLGQRTTGIPIDAFYEKALTLIQSSGAIRAFQLEQENAALRTRYGMTRFGQVNWPARSDDEPVPGPDGSWDTHRNNFPTLRDHRCPVFDHSLSCLIEDLQSRGLLQRTLVVAIGEFGRSPKIGASTTNNVGPGGRDHWPDCYSCLIAGGGVRPGVVYGESDRFGAYPKINPVHPYDLICTVFHALGIDPETEYLDTLDRPRRLVDHGEPVLGLF
jgi:hypothetical protein